MEIDLDDIQDEETLEALLEALVERLSSYLIDLGDIHVIDGELTDLPPTVLDRVH